MEPADGLSYNTALGHSAGKAVTTGTHNTLIGGLAGDALTTGASNVAVGYGALTSDDVGQWNVAIGRDALSAQNIATAANTYNTAVGGAAGAAARAAATLHLRLPPHGEPPDAPAQEQRPGAGAVVCAR